ncbi:MAG: translation initiation factor IF-3 [Deltaproteobacteria bacterium]|nr:translation initiation factor IF-3 [Deltaproteobacteria bacterium]
MGPPRPSFGGPPGAGPPPGGGGPPFGGGGGGGGGGPRDARGRDDRATEPRVNRRIRVREVRVIADDGSQLGILATDDALKRAEEKGLDLVEVQPMARPPVCKIMDYGKFKYEQKRKASELKKKQTVVEVKEVKFRPKTGIHDFDTKVRHLREFLVEGNKARVTIMFRGREIVHPEIGHDILRRVAEIISDIAQVELPPRMEGKQMFMIVAPGKAPARKPGFPAPMQAPQPQMQQPQSTASALAALATPTPPAPAPAPAAAAAPTTTTTTAPAAAAPAPAPAAPTPPPAPVAAAAPKAPAPPAAPAKPAAPPQRPPPPRSSGPVNFSKK